MLDETIASIVDSQKGSKTEDEVETEDVEELDETDESLDDSVEENTIEDIVEDDDSDEDVEPEVEVTEVVGGVSIKNGRQAPEKDVLPETEDVLEDLTGSSEEVVEEPVQTVKHPEYERERDVENFGKLSVTEKLTFSDIFVKEDGLVVYNSEHEKSAARNLSKGVIDYVVKDLWDRNKHVRVSIGDTMFAIRETNSVFTTTTSLMRFLLLNSIEDDNIALQLARQLYLEKHPDGEDSDFDHSRVRTDERDVYALLLSTKKDPERDLAEKVEELIRSVEYAQETRALTDRKLLNHTEQSGHLLDGLNIAASLLVLDRLGLTKGALPNTLDDVRGFITQDDIVKLSDLLGNDIASEVESRRRTIARDERMRRQNERLPNKKPQSSLRYSNRKGSDYSR